MYTTLASKQASNQSPTTITTPASSNTFGAGTFGFDHQS
jgi:hypothetical protein